jgi:hypothetical protein
MRGSCGKSRIDEGLAASLAAKPSCSQSQNARLPSRALDLRDQGESLWNSRLLRRIAFIEMGSDLVERPVVPFLSFGEQLPIIFGMKHGSLTAQGFHRAAVNEFFHRHLPDSVDDI